MRASRWTRRLATATLGAVVAAVAGAGAASAHVTLDPNTAAPGSYGSFSVQVPNEEPKAATTKVEVFMPTDYPIASVSVQPVPGWRVQVTNSKLSKPIKTDDGEQTQAVSKVTWSGGKIGGNEFQRFPLLLGPLPTGVAKLNFKALQTYSNGQVVRWIDIPTGSTEPAHPAPSITLSTVTGAGGSNATAAGADSGAGPGQVGSSDGTAVGLGIAGIVVGAVGIGVGATALRRRSHGQTVDGHAAGPDAASSDPVGS